MPDNLVYLALLLGWALPVLALHWIVGAPELLARWRLLVVAVGVPTVYLSVADAVAIGSGVWSISEELTLGLRAGSLVFEEVLFFLVTNLLVAQSVVLFLSPGARARADRLLHAARSRLSGRHEQRPGEPNPSNDAPAA
jgi:lycopene cyclase domain-containing protein